MIKKLLFILVLTSLVARLIFSWYFPLIADELNIWNMLSQGNNFFDFWQYFIRYDTHQPLFYLLWYPFFSHNESQVLLRLPSILFFCGSIYYWKELFPYSEKDNIVPWLLFLFSPFLMIYSVFFLPYSLLVFGSIYNFYRFKKLETQVSKKNICYFFYSGAVLILIHYYGALQAVLLGCYFIYCSKQVKMKFIFAFLTVALLVFLIMASDFLNDFSDIHNYRHIPHLKDLLGDINLLLGGKFVALILLVRLFMKRKVLNVHSKEFCFIATVLAIAYLKSILISPSLEARYLLILIYPFYFLTKKLQFKFAIPALVLTCLISLHFLEKSFGPSFVINYKNIEKTDQKTGLLITPCPKFYFPETNYICKDYFQQKDQLQADIEEIIVHKDHMVFFSRNVPNQKCHGMGQGLFSCTVNETRF